MLLAFICGSINAGTITFSELGLENGVQYTDPFDGGDFTVQFGGGGNDGKYYNTGTGIRVYGGGSMTLAAKSGNITAITVTYDGSYKPTTSDVVDGGTYNEETGVWTGSAASVVFTRPTGSGHWRIQSVEVTINGSAPTKTATKITFAEGYKTQIGQGPDDMFPEVGSTVALPAATVMAGDVTVGNTVEWSLQVTSWKGKEGKPEPSISDGKINVADGYGVLEVTASYAGNDTYEASSKKYTLTVYNTYGLLKEMAMDIADPDCTKDDEDDADGKPVFYFFRNIDAEGFPVATSTVTYVNGKYIYLTDGDGANLLFYGTNTQNLKKGDVISGNVSNTNLGGFWGNLKRYKKLPEFAFTDMNVKVESEGATVTPTTITIDQLKDNINAYVTVENAEYVSASSKNLTFKVGEAELAVYNQFNVSASALEVGAKYTVEGMVSVNKKDKNTDAVYQLYPISFTKTGEAGINEMKVNTKFEGKTYNMAGQMVTSSYKGLVIMNGRKVVMK
jgi:hypothetical protein